MTDNETQPSIELTVILTQEEAQFVANVLTGTAHQGTTEQIKPLIVLTDSVIAKMVAAAEAARTPAPVDKD
jgi:hypothetical protein